jgi:hypothetical protein
MGAMSPRGRKALSIALKVLLLCTVVEVPCAFATAWLERRGFYYVAQHPKGFRFYMKQRDPELGWVKPADPRELAHLDASGARKLPAFPDVTAKACVSLYGDSFTWGQEIDDEHTWANYLAQHAGCRVADWGVPAYGTDQAYMRFLRAKDDKTPVVLLGILSENVLRNVNVYRGLLPSIVQFGLKPRFVLDEGGALRLVPLPSPTAAEMHAIEERPEDHLPNEFFVPGGPSGITRRTFPYALSLARLFFQYRIRAQMAGVPAFAPFYDPRHPSGALGVTAGIARAFRGEAEGRGAFAGVVMFPTGPDIEVHRKKGTWTYQPLLDAMARDGIPYLNTGEAIEEALHVGDLCSIYRGCLKGHFTARGNRIVGGAVYAWLKSLGKV